VRPHFPLAHPRIGCFAHYINCHRYDANLDHYEKGGEWLTTFDTFSLVMYADGDFALHKYLSYFLVPFHPLFRERGENRVERDTTDWEVSFYPFRNYKMFIFSRTSS
jgi:chromosome transmission fidelity protein 18